MRRRAPCAQRAQPGVGDLCASYEVEIGEVGAPCAQRAQPGVGDLCAPFEVEIGEVGGTLRPARAGGRR